MGDLFGNITNSSGNLEETINGLENVSKFFQPDNITNMIHTIVIWAVVMVVLIIVLKIVFDMINDKRRAKMIAKEVIKELEANGYTSQLKKDPPTTIIE